MPEKSNHAPDVALVTGASGFIGSHLVRRLVEDGRRTHVLLRPESDPWRLADAMDRVVVWRGDVRHRSALDACVAGAAPSTVFHLAGDTGARRSDASEESAFAVAATNVGGTSALLSALGRAQGPPRRVVRVGSLLEYGAGTPPFRETDALAPESPYAASAALTSVVVDELSPRLPFSIVSLKLPLVYGPGRRSDSFVPEVVERCLRGEDVAMTSGDQRRDLLHVDDVVDALLAAEKSDVAGHETVNLGSGRPITLIEVAEMIRRATESSSELVRGARPSALGEIRDSWADIEKARRLLGWSPGIDLAEGLRRTVEWSRAHSRP